MYEIAADFYFWWRGALSGCWRSLSIRWRPDRHPRIFIGKERVDIVGSDGTPIAQALSTPEELAEAIRRIQTPPLIVLKQGRYVVRHLSPISIPHSKAQAAGAFDLVASTPFRPDEVYRFVAHPTTAIVPVPTSMAIVKKKVIEPVLDSLRNAGLPVAGIGLSDDDPVQQSWMLAPAEIAALNRKPGRFAKAPMLIAVLLATATLGTMLHLSWNYGDALDRVEATLPALERKAKEVRAILNRNESRIAEVQSLRRSLADQRTMTETWEEISRILPDTTYLTDMTIKDGRVSLIGFSQSASSVIETIEQSPLFEGSEFTSPVVKVPGFDGDRFDVKLAVVGR